MKKLLFLVCVLVIGVSSKAQIMDSISKIMVMSSPDHARLYVDGQRVGRTPAMLRLLPGEHVVQAYWLSGKAEKNIVLSEHSFNDSTSYQDFVYLECRRRNWSYGEYITKGTLILQGGEGNFSHGEYYCGVSYLKKFGGFLYYVPGISHLLVGPIMHVYGPVCLKAGLGIEEVGSYSDGIGYHRNYYAMDCIFGATFVLKGFTCSFDYYYYHYRSHNGICLGIGWAF